jgi:hypothetical protein
VKLQAENAPSPVFTATSGRESMEKRRMLWGTMTDSPNVGSWSYEKGIPFWDSREGKIISEQGRLT